MEKKKKLEDEMLDVFFSGHVDAPTLVLVAKFILKWILLRVPQLNARERKKSREAHEATLGSFWLNHSLIQVFIHSSNSRKKKRWYQRTQSCA